MQENFSILRKTGIDIIKKNSHDAFTLFNNLSCMSPHVLAIAQLPRTTTKISAHVFVPLKI